MIRISNLRKILIFALCTTTVFAQIRSMQTLSAENVALDGGPLKVGDTVVLANFINRTGDAVFDGTLDQALRSDLDASPFLNVLSDEKAGNTLRMMGRSESEIPSAFLNREICTRNGGKAVIVGTISKLNGRYALDLAAISCKNGSTLATASSSAPLRLNVLNALNQASAALRSKLGEPLSSVQRFEAPSAATTSSLDALKDYSIAVKMQRENGGPPTIPLLKKAIEIDPNFPLAYAMLSTNYFNLRQPALALRCATKAYRLRARVSERERLRISTAYFLSTGQLEREMQIYEQWQAEYPRDYLPYNDLGNDYAAMGSLNDALVQYQKGLRLEPTQIGYVNVGGMYLSLDRLNEAKLTFEEALARNFDGRYLRMSIYWLAFLRGDRPLMARQLTWASGKSGVEDALLAQQSDTEAYYGRIRSAQEFSRRALVSSIRAGSTETAALWQVNEALREAEVGEFAIARREVASALTLSSGRDVTMIAAFTLARSGAASEAKTLTDKLEKDYPTDTLMKLYWLPTIRAALAIDKGNYSGAIDILKPVARYELGGAGTFVNYLYPAYVRGQAYLLAHQGRAAAAEFQKLLKHKGVVLNFVTGSLAQLQIGRAYALAGDTTEAKAAYRNFFMAWSGADAAVPILEQARAENAKLQAAKHRHDATSRQTHLPSIPRSGKPQSSRFCL